MRTDDYKFDVFLSYPRGYTKQKPSLIASWVKKYFHPLLSEYLALEMRTEPAIFIDIGIEKGERWPERIREALLTSRCMVTIWAPPYFRSPWCVSEWQSMLARQKKLAEEEGRDYRLIYPIKFADGNHFWEEAQQTTWEDFSKWAYDGLAFEQSRDFLDFQKKVAEVAADMEAIIANAPPWRSGWPVTLPTLGIPPTPSLPRIITNA